MYGLLKWVGLAILLPSLMIGMAVVAKVQVPYKVEKFAVYAEDPEVEIKEKLVPVPPYNRTPDEAKKLNKQWGWVAFNISLPNQGKPEYRAGGIILYEPRSPEKSEIIMRVVNETDFEALIFFGMEEAVWNTCKIYAEVYLNKRQGFRKFEFKDLDGCIKYCVFFRGLDDGVEDTLILVSMKEAWYEYTTWIPATLTNASILGTTTIVGLSLIIIGFKYQKRRYLKSRIKKFRSY